MFTNGCGEGGGWVIHVIWEVSKEMISHPTFPIVTTFYSLIKLKFSPSIFKITPPTFLPSFGVTLLMTIPILNGYVSVITVPSFNVNLNL